MNIQIVLFAMVAAAVARPGLLGYYPYALSSQYHAQDELGQYSYGYAGGLSAKSEVKSFDGVTRGGYSYVDANGELQTVSYTADALNGFRVAATNLPKAPAPIESAPLVAPEPVQDTPEVATAKAAHLALVSGATPEAPIPAPLVAPVPVQDTPEVAQARAEHLVAVEKAAAAAAAAPEVPEPLIVSSYSLPAHYAYSVSPGANFAYSSVAPAPWAVAPWTARLEHFFPTSKLTTSIGGLMHHYRNILDLQRGPLRMKDMAMSVGDSSRSCSWRGELYKGRCALKISSRHTSASSGTLPPEALYILSSCEPWGCNDHLGSCTVYGVPLAINRTANDGEIRVLVSALLAVALGKPSVYHGYAASPGGVPYSYYYNPHNAVSSQYHAQDELGQYSYGYSGGPSAKHETKTLDGVTRGGYSYINANGIVQTVNYIADDVNGFRVAATNLPVAPASVVPAASLVAPLPVQDTPEVAAAKVAHLAAVSAIVSAPAEPAAPVQDTPEVAQAKAEHLAAVEEAKLASVVATPVVSVSPVSNAYTYSTVPVASQTITYSSPPVSDSYSRLPVRYSSLSGPVPAPSSSYSPVSLSPSYSYSPVLSTHSGLTSLSSQYHAQDELGQYSYGYSGGPSAKHETRTLDGVTRGGYSYIDANGIVQTVNYVADDVNGFRVAATNLPVSAGVSSSGVVASVPETPEVAAATAAHFAAHAEAKARLHQA
uniref:Cuticle protein 6 n=1 Tax=Timema douglasi TaxID=61478 RepID=A0A7R8VFQ4_TIMDO|nr:unnamed protein product [Timema douglasi]